MKYSYDELIALSETTGVKRYATIDKYAILPIQAGGKYHITFVEEDANKYEHMLFVAQEQIKLFCGNFYLPVIHVIRSSYREEVTEFFLRANAIVFTDGHCLLDQTITPISANADMLLGRDHASEEYLRRHFEQQYYSLLRNHPEKFEKAWAKMPKTLPEVDLGIK